MAVIETKEFKLRPVNKSDLKGYWETMQDPATRAALSTPPKTEDEAKEKLEGILAEVEKGFSETFTIEVDGKYAGNVFLQYQDFDMTGNEGRVHLWIHPDFRGKGLATKALDRVMQYGFEKKYERIYAQCKASNADVIKVNEKLGFHKVKDVVTDTGVKKILWVKEKT